MHEGARAQYSRGTKSQRQQLQYMIYKPTSEFNGRSTYASPTTDGFRSLIIRHIASCAAGAFTSPSSSA